MSLRRAKTPLSRWQTALVATLAGCLLLFTLFDGTLEGCFLGSMAAGCLYAISRLWDKAERAAAHFEKHYKIAEESCHAAPYALLAFDADDRCQFINAPARRLFPGEEIASFSDFLTHFSEHRRMHEALRSFAKELPNGGLCHLDVPMALQNKDLMWWRVTAAPLNTLAGGTLWSFADLTPTSQYLNSPEANPIFLLELLHSTTVGYFTVNNAGAVVFCNAVFARWLGMERTEVVGALCCELFTKETGMCLPTVDGPGRFMRSPVVPMVLEGRERTHPVFVQQIFVREGWRTYSALAAEGTNSSPQTHNNRITTFMHMVAQAPIGIMTLDSQGLIGACNDTLCRFMGQDKKRIIGNNIFECLDVSSHIAVKERLREASQPSEDTLEITFIGQEPHAALCHIGLLPSSSDQETEQPLVMYVIDVAHHKHLEERLTQSQKMQAMGQLAGGIAHDFNNLLTAMIGYCDLLLGRYSPNEQPFADVMQIKQNANRASRLVRQLLAFSRQQELQPKVLDVTDILSDLSALLQRLLGTVDLNIIYGSDLGRVQADPVQLEQVIINIAINARDAMPNGGSITIKTYAQEITQQVKIEKDLMSPGRYTVIDI
ncbi:MAG: PAS domain-containing protein, partial [Holosporales bacterium]|nr:PAS domain-containing protein [Holosporales bacterium]